jgi:2,3-bisphosphoglycerate-dependent phosphoglycerate mutase
MTQQNTTPEIPGQIPSQIPTEIPGQIPSEIPSEIHRQTRWAVPENSTEFLLVRHGATRGLSGDDDRFPLVDGHGDPELHAEGHRQATLVAARLAIESVDALYVTTLQRTHQTAAPIAEHLGLTPIVEADLREVFLGEWEGGASRKFAMAQDPRWLAALKEGEWGNIPGAETTAQLEERCMRALRAIHAERPGQRVICVVHGGVIGAICGSISGAQGAFQGADNCSISHVVGLGDWWRIRSYNDTAHLGGYTPATHL